MIGPLTMTGPLIRKLTNLKRMENTNSESSFYSIIVNPFFGIFFITFFVLLFWLVIAFFEVYFSIDAPKYGNLYIIENSALSIILIGISCFYIRRNGLTVLNKPNSSISLKKFIFLIFMFLMLITISFYLWECITKATVLPKSNISNLEIISKNKLATYISLILTVGILSPISEELFFRGLAYTAIKNKFSMPLAAIVTSVVFSIIHFDIYFFIVYFFIGIVLVISLELTQTILAPIILHVTYNILFLIGAKFF